MRLFSPVILILLSAVNCLFAADGNASLGQKVFDISVAQIESIVEPDCIADDVRWKSVAFVGIHHQIIEHGDLICQLRIDDLTEGGSVVLVEGFDPVALGI